MKKGAVRVVTGWVVLWVAVLALQARADGFRNPPDTAMALGKAGVCVAWVDDPSAVNYNPANLADIHARQIEVAAWIGYSHAEYDSAMLHTETEDPWVVMPSVYAVWPLSTDWALGFGAHIPYGRQTRWEADGLPKAGVPLLTKMMVMDIGPSLSWRVSDSFSAGVGLDVYYGRLQFRQLLSWPGGEAKAEADGFGVGANAGLTWRLTPDQRLALTCRTPFQVDFEGDMRVTHIPPPMSGMVHSSSDVSSTFQFPTIVALAYGLRVSETVRIEADVEWLQFSRNQTLKINGGSNSALLGPLARIPQNWNDTWTFGIGGDWQFAADWTLRAGYRYLPTPVPDTTFMPSMLDSNQSAITLGLGYRSGSHSVDLAYALALLDTRKIRANPNPAYNADYTFNAHVIAVSYTYAY